MINQQMAPFITKILIFILLTASTLAKRPEDFLSLGDNALASDKIQDAIEHYKEGIDLLVPQDSPQSLITVLSLYTNLGTSLSSLGQNEDASEAYRKALELHPRHRGSQRQCRNFRCQWHRGTGFLFLGMVYQELDDNKRAASSYAYAHTLDPLHWSSLANLGAVLKENLRLSDDALAAYNKAYEILTQSEQEPTDAPAHPEYILAELQYRIGYILMENPARKCAMTDEPEKEVDCKELASHALSLALQFQPDHESAKHMLATLTTDATMKRASNKYVKSLFDDYAKNFEHSLVEELHYNGYERLRHAADRAFSSKPRLDSFAVVVDAGCGTGLVGEQFRNWDVTQVFVEKKPISLIIAADSYIYFGDMGVLFQSMQEGLEEGAFAAFTLENVDRDSLQVLAESKPDWRWQLTASGRFAHNRHYVEDIGKEHDLHLFHYEPLENFRYENGKGVNGHIFIMQKRTTHQEL
ncbi:methyltransferase domain-containing protein [Fragilaria crotonensis]|nr:methyltransferase domain-containing protein [Fragilaria crotonensis]